MILHLVRLTYTDVQNSTSSQFKNAFKCKSCFSSQGDTIDEEMDGILKKIKEDMAANGAKSSSATPESKLVYVWKKYERTSEEYKKMVEEVQLLKKQRKKDIDDTEKSLHSIRQLSQSKDNHIANFKTDNEKLSKQIQQLKLEREAYLKGNQAFADLLVTEGMTEFDRANPQKYIEQLVKDKKKCTKEKEELEEQYGEFQILKAQQLNDVQEQLKKKEEELQNALKESTSCTESLSSLEKKYAELQEKVANEHLRDKQDLTKSLEKIREELAEEKLKVEEADEAKTAGTSYTVLISELF